VNSILFTINVKYNPYKYQNGFDAFRSGWYKNQDVVCVHANHMVGIDNKLNAFKTLGVDL
jgi:hypothetical protein